VSGWTPSCGYAEENIPQSPNPEPLISITAGFDLEGVQLAEAGLQDIQAAWEVLYEKIGKESGILAHSRLYHDISILVKDFNAQELDLVMTTALNYLRMIPEVASNRYPDIYGPVAGGQKTHRYLLLVRADSGVSGVAELQGKVLIMKNSDKTGTFYLNTLLLRHGQTESERFFRSIQEVDTFSQAVLAVFFKKGGACLTTQSAFEVMVELNPQVGKQLSILDSSPLFANPVLFFHKRLAQDTKDLIIETLLNFETSVLGQQFLMLHRIDSLIPFEPSDLDSLRALLQEYETYKH